MRRPGNPLREPSKQVLHTGEVAKRFGMSRRWAYELLRRWFRSQEEGGEVRAFRVLGPNGQYRFATTLGVLQRYAPQARDEYLHREVRRLNKDVDVLAGRVDRLTHERDALDKRLREVERVCQRALTNLPRRAG